LAKPRDLVPFYALAKYILNGSIEVSPYLFGKLDKYQRDLLKLADRSVADRTKRKLLANYRFSRLLLAVACCLDEDSDTSDDSDAESD
jgi:hypothetical protein